jgi:hypothetical protein
MEQTAFPYNVDRGEVFYDIELRCVNNVIEIPKSHEHVQYEALGRGFTYIKEEEAVEAQQAPTTQPKSRQSRTARKVTNGSNPK